MQYLIVMSYYIKKKQISFVLFNFNNLNGKREKKKEMVYSITCSYLLKIHKVFFFFWLFEFHIENPLIVHIFISYLMLYIASLLSKIKRN